MSNNKTDIGIVHGMHNDTESTVKLSSKGLMLERLYSIKGIHPFDQVKWEKRTAFITNEKGNVIFEQKDVEVPDSWSQLAVNVVISKYFHGKPGTPERETSIKQLIGRVVNTTTEFGWKDGYFADEESRDVFRDELTYLLVNQHLAFNSPVWFNVGVEEGKPQCSACFINSIQDNLESIMNLVKTEGMLFKYGSGTGTNLSPLRSSKESLSGGGTSSGPISFMKGFDSFAGVIKSGGKTRRAAKMVILNDNHPDIIEFINCKASEEKKAWALIDAGYDGSFNGEAYSSVFFQNANHSIRASDEFLNAVVEDGKWTTKYVNTNEDADTYNARDLMKMIAESTHVCGDPGLQYDSTINKWHTCKNSGRINASNPCSEYVFLDDTACNLASINLMKYLSKDGNFDIKGYIHTIDISILAQEIFVGNASYPTKAIEKNSEIYRTLGLGYANLGALLMAEGLPYDSEKGRNYAAVLTSIMTGEAYNMSSKIAEKKGTFEGFELNKEPMLEVIEMHKNASEKINSESVSTSLYQASMGVWQEAYKNGKKHGFRNAQVTVLAPTGTIAFLMDCDTTGIEPDIALVKYKKLVGGGFLKIVNNTVPLALKNLGYKDDEIDQIIKYIDENETIEGAPNLKQSHLPVFDCAFRPLNGTRSIQYMGHVRMMSAVQPFISGAISKTVNMPSDATVEEIYNTYIEAWKLGLKAVAIYRDGCKRTQPLNTSKNTSKTESATIKPYRRKLPDERKSLTHKFSIAGHEGYITVGMYEDGTLGEVFITMAKEGSTISGLMDSLATSISLALQYGVPLKVLIDKFAHTRFEPSGFTQNKNIPFAKSIMDYIFRWIAIKFDENPSNQDDTSATANKATVKTREVPETQQAQAVQTETITETKTKVQTKGNGSSSKGKNYSLQGLEKVSFLPHEDSPPCMYCGSIMVRNGSCYKCINCGGTSGCS